MAGGWLVVVTVNTVFLQLNARIAREVPTVLDNIVLKRRPTVLSARRDNILEVERATVLCVYQERIERRAGGLLVPHVRPARRPASELQVARCARRGRSTLIMGNCVPTVMLVTGPVQERQPVPCAVLVRIASRARPAAPSVSLGLIVATLPLQRVPPVLQIPAV